MVEELEQAPQNQDDLEQQAPTQDTAMAQSKPEVAEGLEQTPSSRELRRARAPTKHHYL
ncbi:hypothetical protein HBZS_113590 [Helicobacter bizzozeronii CCUG 35545]|nr:hypothetical protein HBZS_113590 [Helicobacter bizzozeronii CCUG 35545]